MINVRPDERHYCMKIVVISCYLQKLLILFLDTFCKQFLKHYHLYYFVIIGAIGVSLESYQKLLQYLQSAEQFFISFFFRISISEFNVNR